MKRIIYLLMLFVWSSNSFAQITEDNYRNWERTGGNKVALIIGIDKYAHINPLQYATQDAQIIQKALEKQGYEIIEAYNLDLKNFKEVINELRHKLNDYSTLIIFYAGHGAEINGVNFLIPTDASPQDGFEFEDYCVDLDYIFRRINNPDIPKLLILDACRVNPLDAPPSYRDGIHIQKKNTRLIYSTASSTKVKDENPFAEILADNIRNGGCIDDIIKKTTAAVEEEAIEEQIVWIGGTLKDDICFDNISSTVEKPKTPRPEPSTTNKNQEIISATPTKPKTKKPPIGIDGMVYVEGDTFNMHYTESIYGRKDTQYVYNSMFKFL